MQVDGYPELGVVLQGEALGESEAKVGRPFVGAAGLRLGRMIERAGFRREQFQILNACWCRPPKNREPFQAEIDHCRQYWELHALNPACKVLVPMGNVALFASTGHEGILSKRGYVEWSERYQCFILPTVHPSFILRGNHAWEAAWLYDLRHAVEVAREGWRPIEREYTLDPSPNGAQGWLEAFKRKLLNHPTLALSYDLETPDKGAAEDEVDINLGYLAGPIYRIGFAYVDPETGMTQCLSIPWEVSYFAIIQALLALRCPKVVCYRHFDNPRIAAHGVIIEGAMHDLQEMWHVLHPDLPKNLEHITPYLCPNQPAWKHLNAGDTQAYYNAVDSGVEVEGYYRVMALLKEHGMWGVYERDVWGLNKILLFMSAKGMPINLRLRKRAAWKVGVLKESVRERLNAEAKSARPTKVYKKKQEGLEEIAIEAEERYCSECGKAKVNAKHPCFRVGVAAGEVPLGELSLRLVTATGWVKPLDFKPSQKGLIRYATFMGYKLKTRWDKQKGERVTSMDENTVRRYALDHPEDKLWPLVLEARELTKLQGTYIGTLKPDPPKQRNASEEWWEAWRAAQYRESPVPKDRSPQLWTPTPMKEARAQFDAADDEIPF